MTVFIELVQALGNAGDHPRPGAVSDLEPGTMPAPTPRPPSVITPAWPPRLVADFAAVDTGFALARRRGTPTAAIAKNLMTLVYGPDTTDKFFGLLNNPPFTTLAALFGAARPKRLA